jgi:hypothetical protein
VKGDFRLLVWLRAHFGIGAALLCCGPGWHGAALV